MVNETVEAPARDNADVASDIADAGNRMDKERQALSETLGDTRDAVAEEAKVLGKQAAETLETQAEAVKDEAAAGLASFSEALKAASAQLSGQEQLGFAGDLVQQAAGGLGSLAQSLEKKSPQEMLEEMRSFGRQNPVAFIAGSMLAGFALGRVATVAAPKASAPATAPTTQPEVSRNTMPAPTFAGEATI